MRTLLKLLIARKMKDHFWLFRENFKTCLRYADLILDKYSWELSQKNEIGNLMTLLNEAHRAVDFSRQVRQERYEEIRDIQADHQKELEQKEANIIRMENEIKHLKDIVQAKNLVIDKLLSEKQ